MSVAPARPTLDPAELHRVLSENGIEFYAGVPDSLLKDFIAYLSEHTPLERHVIAANEGGAIALAAGYHLATGRIAAVYLQNSGLGNAINPLTSLVDPEVYGIPVLLIVGWRGMPGVADEPQHRKQGRVTTGQLDVLGFPYVELTPDVTDLHDAVSGLLARMNAGRTPGVLLVAPGTFSRYRPSVSPAPRFGMRREDALRIVLDRLDPLDVVVCTTGMASREVFEARERAGQAHDQDFLTVGSMGHCSQIALGLALAQPDRRTICLDGDGSVIMHMGALAIIGARGPANLHHVVINNGVHDSVGAQPTVGFSIDLPAIAAACGYRATRRVGSIAEVASALGELGGQNGPTLLEIRVDPGAREDLGRPTLTPAENKERLMEFLRRR